MVYEKSMARETKAALEKRTKEILALFGRYYPDAHCALNHENPEQLLIATVLSAQCTDERVNRVTPALFKKFPDLRSLSLAKLEDIEAMIHSTGFYRNKAKNLKALAQVLVEHHGGKVPPQMEVLVGLPGVGRKTANVVMGNSFQMATGIVVDTHVQRVSYRLGLTQSSQPAAIERDLMKLVPASQWVMFSHWMITHGRLTCKARKPQCERCFLLDICPQKIG